MRLGKCKQWLLLVCALLASSGSMHVVAASAGLLGSQAERMLLEKENTSISSSILSARTERIDPLDDFKKYRGGYNITNKHYWSSTIFTGKYGYSIAALWLVGGLVYAGIRLIITICFTNKQRKKKESPGSNSYNFWYILVGFIFTILVIVASGVVLGGSSSFHSEAHSIKNIIVRTAEQASGVISNVTSAVRAMQDDTQLYANIEGSTHLNSTSKKLNDEANGIQNKAIKTMRLVNKGLKILNVITIVTTTLNLIVILSLLGLSILVMRRPKFRHALHLVLIICWLLTFLIWMYFGLYYFLDKFASDTCTALDDYQRDPRNSSLGSVLPCNDQRSTMAVLRDIGAGIHGIINQVNANFLAIQSLSIPGVEYICNPFSGPPAYTYQPERCSPATTQIGDIQKILSRYTCSDTCREGEFIPPSIYRRALVYTNSMQSILNTFPGMEKLANCQLVKDAFSDILHNRCRPLKRDVHMTWAALAALSTLMVVLTLIWMLGASHYMRRHPTDGSVKPHSTPRESSEIDTAEMTSRQQEV